MEFYFKEVDQNVMIVRVDGGLDSQNANDFRQAVEKLIEGGIRCLILDCEQMHFISSYGIGVILRLHQNMAKCGGDVKIASLQGVVWDLLHIASLDRVFSIYPDVNQARLAYRPPDIVKTMETKKNSDSRPAV